MLKLKGTLYLLITVAILLSTPATAAPVIKNGGNYLQLVEAYTQRMLPGARGSEQITNQHIIIIWQGANFPKVFCWRSLTGFTSCSVEKAHAISAKNKHNFPPGMAYATEKIVNNAIQKGDTLILTPIVGTRPTMPKKISAAATNTLYFKTGHSGWLSMRVDKISKKADIALP